MTSVDRKIVHNVTDVVCLFFFSHKVIGSRHGVVMVMNTLIYLKTVSPVEPPSCLILHSTAALKVAVIVLSMSITSVSVIGVIVCTLSVIFH